MGVAPERRVDHWLYRIVPRSRSEATWLTWLPWALVGNDDDGIFGEQYQPGFFTAAGGRPTLWVAVRWWVRNPLYNLCTRVVSWPREWVLVACGWYDDYGPQRFYWKPQFRWLAEGYPEKPRQAAIVLWPPYLMRVGERWEWYAGWGSRDGRLGFAYRRRDAKDAADLS